MEIITRQSLADSAVELWKVKYANCLVGGHYEHWKPKYGLTKAEILEKLEKLPTPKNPDEIDKIIGSDSWTRVPACCECDNQQNEFVVMVGEELDYESKTTYLCKSCIDKLSKLVETAMK
jgi:hypothetical protein